MSRTARLIVTATRFIAKRYGSEVIGTVLSVLPDWVLLEVLKELGAEIGDHTTIRSGIRIINVGDPNGLKRLHIGKHCYLGFDCLLDISGEIYIQDDATLSPRVTILSHQDVGDRPLAALYPATKSCTVIGKASWVGACSTILGGVQIGEAAVVAAGATVTREVRAKTLAGGVPATLLREIHLS